MALIRPDRSDARTYQKTKSMPLHSFELTPLNQRRVPSELLVFTHPMFFPYSRQNMMQDSSSSIGNSQVQDHVGYGYFAAGIGRHPIRLEWSALFDVNLSGWTSTFLRSSSVDHVSIQQTLTWAGKCGCWSLSFDVGIVENDFINSGQYESLSLNEQQYEWRAGLRAQLGLPDPQLLTSSSFRQAQLGLR